MLFFTLVFPYLPIITSLEIQPNYILTAEHFFYIASIGIFVVMVLFARYLYQESMQNRLLNASTFRFIVVFYFIFLHLLTIINVIYSLDDINLYARTLGLNPDNIRISYVLSAKLVEENKFEQAEKHLRKLVQIDPGSPRARISLGSAYAGKGELKMAAQYYEKALNVGDN